MKLFDKSSEYTPLKPAVQSSENSDWSDWQAWLGVGLISWIVSLFGLILYAVVGALVVLWPILVVCTIIGLVALVVGLGLYLKPYPITVLSEAQKKETGKHLVCDQLDNFDILSSEDNIHNNNNNENENENENEKSADITDELRIVTYHSQNVKTCNCLPNNSLTPSNYALENCDITEALGANQNDEFRSVLINH